MYSSFITAGKAFLPDNGGKNMRFQVMLQQLSRGFGSTLMIFCLTLLFSLPLGLVIYFGRVSRFKPLSLVVKCYISVMRGTPLMLQLLLSQSLLHPASLTSSPTRLPVWTEGSR